MRPDGCQWWTAFEILNPHPGTKAQRAVPRRKLGRFTLGSRDQRPCSTTSGGSTVKRYVGCRPLVPGRAAAFLKGWTPRRKGPIFKICLETRSHCGIRLLRVGGTPPP
eukprot:1661720-Rhodomonas_salina.1